MIMANPKLMKGKLTQFSRPMLTGTRGASSSAMVRMGRCAGLYKELACEGTDEPQPNSPTHREKVDPR